MLLYDLTVDCASHCYRFCENMQRPGPNDECRCHGKTWEMLAVDLAQLDREKASNAQRRIVLEQQQQVAADIVVDSLDPATRLDQLHYKNAALEIARDKLIELTLEKLALNERMEQVIRCWAELGPHHH